MEPSTKFASYSFPRHSWVDAHIQPGSTTDLNSISIEVDSDTSSPDGPKVCSSAKSVSVKLYKLH